MTSSLWKESASSLGTGRAHYRRCRTSVSGVGAAVSPKQARSAMHGTEMARRRKE
jgi:hypothetical protein